MRLSSLGTWLILLGLSLPVWAGEQPGAISGYVRDNSGIPQMGAVVEILGAANRTLTVFTDGAGYYTASGLLPGLYTLKVTAPSFLPALREKVLHPGAKLNVNVTLSTLLGVMQLGPARPLPDEDDWKWTLRSVANRPILRVFDDPISNGLEQTAEKQTHELSGTVSFLAGSAAGGYGTGSDMSTGFTLERSIFADGHLSFSGDIGYGSSLPAGVLRTTYSRRLPDGSAPTLGLTVRRFSPSDPALHNATLQALDLSAGDDFTVADVLELKFGSEVQSVQFLGHATAFRPYGSADLHLSPNTVLEYNYATSRPDLRSEKGFDSAPADLSESNPRVSLLNFAPKMESAHHHEVSLSRRAGKINLQVAAYSDRVGDPALLGTGEATAVGGFILPDVSSGTFTYAGKTLDTNGLRFVLQRKFSDDLTATLDYALGGVVDLSKPDVSLQQAQQYLSTQRRHAVAAKLSGTTAHTHTRWIASYRWVNGPAVTPVDMFNASPGQSDPFLNIFIRQPIPSLGGHMEAIIDVRNLLAQGYIPILGQDGQTVYLVQAARSVRGGVSFTF
ncbi:MAG: carboxypeptidase-like regulatory domain-containing protein [Candidatus Sulfotelmatobacter sp.]